MKINRMILTTAGLISLLGLPSCQTGNTQETLQGRKTQEHTLSTKVELTPRQRAIVSFNDKFSRLYDQASAAERAYLRNHQSTNVVDQSIAKAAAEDIQDYTRGMQRCIQSLRNLGADVSPLEDSLTRYKRFTNGGKQ